MNRILEFESPNGTGAVEFLYISFDRDRAWSGWARAAESHAGGRAGKHLGMYTVWVPKTRRSLFYLASYLSITGLGLLFTPQAFLKLLFANHTYPGAFVQFSGILMIGLAIVVMNVIRYGNRMLYRTTLMARIPMWICVLGLYVYTRETFFVVVLCVLGLGIVLTGSFYLAERGNPDQAFKKL